LEGARGRFYLVKKAKEFYLRKEK
jgi:hypothetical protein